MEIAKMTSKGQLTIPKDVRIALGLNTGDKVLFIEKRRSIFYRQGYAQGGYEGEYRRCFGFACNGRYRNDRRNAGLCRKAFEKRNFLRKQDRRDHEEVRVWKIRRTIFLINTSCTLSVIRYIAMKGVRS